MNKELLELKQSLLAPFPAALVAVRTQPSVQAYVTARTVMDRLDECIPFQWSFELKEHWYDENKVLHQRGRLTIHTAVSMMVYEDVGSAPPDPPRVQSKQSKQAVSDCLKRCGIQAGIGRYLYALRGVSPKSLPQEAVETAARAVGWRGTIHPDMYGPIGGRRELSPDDEDTEGDLEDPITEYGRSQSAYEIAEGVKVSAEAKREGDRAFAGKWKPTGEAVDPTTQDPTLGADDFVSEEEFTELFNAKRITDDTTWRGTAEERDPLVTALKVAAQALFVTGSPAQFSNSLFVETLRQEIPGLKDDRPVVPQLSLVEMRELLSEIAAGKNAFGKEVQKARHDYRRARNAAQGAGLNLTTFEIAGGTTATSLKTWTKGLREAIENARREKATAA